MTIMKKWKVNNELCLFPKEWNKEKVMSWVNADYIRLCPICNKLDVSYNHFNKCNPSEERAIQANRDMAGI